MTSTETTTPATAPEERPLLDLLLLEEGGAVGVDMTVRITVIPEIVTVVGDGVGVGAQVVVICSDDVVVLMVETVLELGALEDGVEGDGMTVLDIVTDWKTVSGSGLTTIEVCTDVSIEVRIIEGCTEVIDCLEVVGEGTPTVPDGLFPDMAMYPNKPSEDEPQLSNG